MPPITKRPAYIQKPLRFISWLAFPVVKSISYLRAITSGRRARVRALILHSDHVLLVRNNGDDTNWTLPGGGVNAKEEPNIALQRELSEELGIQGSNDYFAVLKPLTTLKAKDINEFSDRAVYKVDFLKAFASSTIIRPNIELLDAAWYPTQNLPHRTSKIVHSALIISQK